MKFVITWLHSLREISTIAGKKDSLRGYAGSGFHAGKAGPEVLVASRTRASRQCHRR
jgi:hypothetical protein